MKRTTSTAQKHGKWAENRLTHSSPSFKTDSERRLKWLLGFALESSEPRTPAERRRVYEQIHAYLGGLHIRQKGDGARVRELGEIGTLDNLRMRGKDNQKPLNKKLALIRTVVRRVVHDFLSTPTVALRVSGEIAWQRILEKDPGRAPTFREQEVAADVREGITFRLLEDLAQAGILVRRCPATGCGQVFVRRYRQEFCSTACRNRTNFRAWYARTRKEPRATFLMPRRASNRKRPSPLRRARVSGNLMRRAKSA